MAEDSDQCTAAMPSSDSSTHGAEMLIRLKDRARQTYIVLQPGEQGQGDGAELVAPHEVIDQRKVQSNPFIADGFSNSKAISKCQSVAVQANDYEIERRSGILPARRRIIPFKFRDFKNSDEVNIDDMDDDDYDPDDTPVMTTRRPRKTTPKPGARSVGRPRKIRKDHAYDRTGEQGGEETNDKDGQAMAADGENESNRGSEVAQENSDKKKEERSFPRRGRPRKSDAYQQPKVFRCLQCDKRFSLKGNLKVHMRTHTDERPFRCEQPECGKAFRSNESLRRHTLAHQGIKLFGCEICKRRFSSNVALREHIARHNDTKDEICPVCQRAFRQLSCLRRHILTHTNEQPHACHVCGKRFAQAVYLRSHMRSHTGERPYKCVTCGKGFAHQSDMTRHMTIHLGTKPYVCDVCGARFSDPSTKRRHVREHTGFKPYTCQLCGDNFKRSGQLKAHLNKKHMNYKEEVAISKEGTFNSLQFEFKGNKDSGVVEQFQTEHQTFVQDVVQQVQTGDGQGELLTWAVNPESRQMQVIDENGQLRQLQVQLVEAIEQPPEQQLQQEDQQQEQQPQQQQQQQEQQAEQEHHQQQQQQQQQKVQEEQQWMLNQIQQQLVQAGFSKSQLDGNQIILAQTNSAGQEELLEETQRIIQQIQSQLGGQGHIQGPTGSEEVKVAYQILHDDDNQQIVEIHYQPVKEASGESQLLTVVEGAQDDGQSSEVLLQQHNDVQMVAVSDTGTAVQQDMEEGAAPVVTVMEEGTQETQIQVVVQETSLPPTTESSTVAIDETPVVVQEEEPDSLPLAPSSGQYHVREDTGQEQVPQLALQHREQAQLQHRQTHVQVQQQHFQQQQNLSAKQSDSSNEPRVGQSDPSGDSQEQCDSHLPDESELADADSTETSRMLAESQEEAAASEESALATLQELQQQQHTQVSIDYVANPDFNCQEYYNWLSSFTELCKQVPSPLEVDLFQKISQVHKTLSDVLATPRGILTNKDNFRTLMNISKELNGIISEHLNFVLQNLDPDIEMDS